MSQSRFANDKEVPHIVDLIAMCVTRDHPDHLEYQDEGDVLRPKSIDIHFNIVPPRLTAVGDSNQTDS